MKKIDFQVDARLAKLLASYRSSELALKELVDNAWDADAETIKIDIPTPMSGEPLIIEDDGTGMTEAELRNEYFLIASDRRQRRGELTKGKNRKVKGKKGIGKFAGLMVASSMSFETWARGKKCQFVITKNDYDSATDIEKLSIPFTSIDYAKEKQGVRIILRDLNQSLAYPVADKLRQLLLREYGRENGFSIIIDNKELGVDDLQGDFSDHSKKLEKIGNVSLRFSISDQKSNLRQPGLSIRVDGKIIGKPSFFGLDKLDYFPQKLLKKLYGEVEADGLVDHVTADWGALIENSHLYLELKNYIEPILMERFNEVYGREINLAQARLKRSVDARLSKLPEYKREFADKAFKKVAEKYYGESESRVTPIVNVILDALERTDYRTIIEYIHDTKHSDVAKIAEVLSEFGLLELAMIGEQGKARLEFLDKLEELCDKDETDEQIIHEALENNLWMFDVKYTLFSSNKTLKKQIENYFKVEYVGERANKRPDLLLTANYANEYLLIEFKRPSHSLKFKDYQQATAYRNDFLSYTNSKIKVLLVGGKRADNLSLSQNHEPNVEIFIFSELISNARHQLNWLLKELGGEIHA